MEKARAWLRVCVVAALVCALGVTFAGTASARSTTKAKKQAAAKKLIRQLKKHPMLIKNRKWLRAAAHVDAQLPLTIRLNQVVDTDGNHSPDAEVASDDTATLDLSETFGPDVGSQTTTITGKVHVLATFGNPAEGDALGDLRLSVTDADLWASSVGVLENPNAGAECPAPPPTYSVQHLPAGLANGFVTSLGAPASNSQLAPSVNANTVFRTAPIHLTSVNTGGSPNIGKANLFATADNVRLQLHTAATITSVFRSLEDGSGLPAGFIPSALFHCDEVFAGLTDGSAITNMPQGDHPGVNGHQNLIPVNVVGSLEISPAITTDGRLRLAKVDVHSPNGEYEHATADACLQPHALVDTATARGHSTFATGSATALVDVTPPGTACDAAYPATPPGGGAFPLSLVGVQEITPASAKFVNLEPNVTVNGLTAEGLIGTF